MKLIKMLSSTKRYYRGKNPCNFITIHETANQSKGANAVAHARYMNNPSTTESWHYTVDDRGVVQHLYDSTRGIHAGSTKGNYESIGIEMCVNSDGDYAKTIYNTVELIQFLMKKHNIPINRVVQHNYWSGKNCPTLLRRGHKGITWNSMRNLISGVQRPTVKPEQTFKSIDDLAREVIQGKHGNGNQRRKSLGNNYNAIQKRVNQLI